MLTEQQVKSKYGNPGDTGNLVTIKLPYPMRIAWDLFTTVGSIQCHKLIADKLKAVFTDLLNHYGLAELRRLRIDVFGGCYNFRKMRGGTSWSKHAWGIAIDLDPDHNQLKTPWKDAEFSKPEYAAMIDIFYKHGFFSLGKEKNYDGMHFEIKE